MKVLVTGASGFLGYHTCNYFLKKGWEVKGLDIADFDYPDISGKVEFYKGSVNDIYLLELAMLGVDVVIHCAGALPLWSSEAIWATNTYGTMKVLNLSRMLGVKRVVYISSTSVYGIPEVHPVYEDSPLVGVGDYGTSKIWAEKICGDYRDELCVPILRPKTFAGAKRLGVFQILCDWVKSGKNIPIVGNGNNKYQLLHIDDLVDAIYLVATAHEDMVNDTFNVGATEFGTMKSDLQQLLDYAGFGKGIVCIPSWLVIPVLKVLEKLHLSPLYEWIYETADKDHYVSVDKIQQKLGWIPIRSTADVWIDTYKWYLEEYANKKVKTGISHRVAWKQGVLKLAKVFF